MLNSIAEGWLARKLIPIVLTFAVGLGGCLPKSQKGDKEPLKPVLRSSDASKTREKADSIHTPMENSSPSEGSPDPAVWTANEVPVLIMLGQSNTDGRAVYSFSRTGPEKGRVLAYPGSTSYPCELNATPTAPSCDQLDLRSIFIDRGKIARGLGRPSLEFTNPEELMILGKVLRGESEWNTSPSGSRDPRVQVYVTRFAGHVPRYKFLLNPLTGRPDIIPEAEFFSINKSVKGWWEPLQPVEANIIDTPAHLRNAIVGGGSFNGKEIFGPELALAVKWRANHRDQPLYIIKFAVGGSALSPNGLAYKNWSTQASNLWDPANKAIRDALAGIEASGRRPRLVGIFWGQGESDANAVDAPLYEKRLKDFFIRIRSDIGQPEAPIFLLQLYRNNNASRQMIRKAQSQACDAVAKCIFLSLDDFRQSQDSWMLYPGPSENEHFTAHGATLIGNKLYEALSISLPNAGAIEMH